MTKPERNKRGSAASAIAIFMIALLSLPAVSEAHTRIGKRPAWYLMTQENTDDRPGKEADPLVILWTRGPLAPETTQQAVRDRVTQYWRGPRSFTFGQVCLGQGSIARKIKDSGVQWAHFRVPNRPKSRDLNDYQGSSHPTCLYQWHMRFWDDHEHWLHTGGSGTAHNTEKQWAVSGTHYDIPTGTFTLCYFGARNCKTFPKGHRVEGRWNHYRNLTVGRYLKGLCGRSRYRLYPGGDRIIRRKRFDGYHARVEFKGDTTGCPRGLN